MSRLGTGGRLGTGRRLRHTTNLPPIPSGREGRRVGSLKVSPMANGWVTLLRQDAEPYLTLDRARSAYHRREARRQPTCSPTVSGRFAGLLRVPSSQLPAHLRTTCDRAYALRTTRRRRAQTVNKLDMVLAQTDVFQSPAL